MPNDSYCDTRNVIPQKTFIDPCGIKFSSEIILIDSQKSWFNVVIHRETIGLFEAFFPIVTESDVVLYDVMSCELRWAFTCIWKIFASFSEVFGKLWKSF